MSTSAMDIDVGAGPPRSRLLAEEDLDGPPSVPESSSRDSLDLESMSFEVRQRIKKFQERLLIIEESNKRVLPKLLKRLPPADFNTKLFQLERWALVLSIQGEAEMARANELVEEMRRLQDQSENVSEPSLPSEPHTNA